MISPEIKTIYADAISKALLSKEEKPTIDTKRIAEIDAEVKAHDVARALRKTANLRSVSSYRKAFLITAADQIESIQAQLTESKRRERAAVEDMKNIADAVRNEHCDEACCFACKFNADFSITDSGSYANECPGFDKDDCFEWRGSPGEGVNQ